MAKLGNETSLILKLAKERITARLLEIKQGNHRSDYNRGFVNAVEAYDSIFNTIKLELERK